MDTTSFRASLITLLAPLLVHRSAANTWTQDRSWEQLDDPTLRREVAQLGGYPEAIADTGQSTLNELALRTSTAGAVEFYGGGIRVRLEAQPFEHGSWVKRSRGNTVLEGRPILGWPRSTTQREGLRMSRLEVVWDGWVAQVPVQAYDDLFDPLLQQEDGARYVLAARSADGWRLYVHAQIGEGAEARLVTWVFEDGRYLFRVIDRATWG